MPFLTYILCVEFEEEGQELTAQVDSATEELERLQAMQADDSRGMSKHQKSTERYLAKRELLTSRRDACNKNIRDLGVLPEEAFEKYTTLKLERVSFVLVWYSLNFESLMVNAQLVKQLHKVQDGLKKFAHVNKKAFEQYNNFTKQRDQLLKRREDLDKSATSIQDLVQVLDQRKDEAIERTFKQVSKYFSEVFERLVPAGRGRLVMQKNVDKVRAWTVLIAIFVETVCHRNRKMMMTTIANHTVLSTIILASPLKHVDD